MDPIQQTNNKQPLINTKKKLSIVIIAIILILFCGLIAGLYFGQNQGELLTPTVVPTMVVATATPEPTKVTPTPTDIPSVYEDWDQYVLTECQVKLYIPDDWLAGKRGEDAACGTFSLNDSAFENFDNYDGVRIVIANLQSESVYALGQQSNIAKYMNDLETDPEQREDDRDFLFEQKDIIIDNSVFTKLKVDKVGLGLTNIILYEAYGVEYVITWGGRSTEENQKTVTSIINSIEFLQPLDGDKN